ncbi:MAG: NRDE family protein [Rhodospirillales bacterium]
MCTVIILLRPGHPWPVLIAANRDELPSRPSTPPGRHWTDRPGVTAGMDDLSGGTWLGLNDDGLFACVLNRVGTLGSAAGKRSRGELPLEALDHAEAREAYEALRHLDTRAYRGFNLVIADAQGAYWLSGDGDGAPTRGGVIGDGLHMITAHGLDDLESARIRRHLPRFRASPAPDVEAGDWFAWETLLASTDAEPGATESGAMLIGDGSGFGTVSASLVALPASAMPAKRPIFRHAPGRPGEVAFGPVEAVASKA